MRHVSHVIERLTVDGRDLPLAHGTVMIVTRDGDQVDWEVIARTLDLEPMARSRHALALRVVEGTDLEGRLVFAMMQGDAIFVRAVERTIVFRGDSPLSGFDPGALA